MIAEFAAGALAFPEFSPAIFTIPEIAGIGPFPIRWYALGYIAGIMIAWWYVLKMVARPKLFGGSSPGTREDIDDFIFWIMLGIILGGRLGYILFYTNGSWISNPLTILRVWEGGMSFHGGFIGTCLAILYVARKRGLMKRLANFSDMAAIVAPIGIGLVRVANFLNAELFGRPTESSWGVVFPMGNAGEGTPPAYKWSTGEWVYCTDTGQVCAPEVARHASQLYEAGLEGLLPLIVLTIGAYAFGWLKRPWLCTGLFILMYGLGRIFAENFRMPDAQIEFLLGTDWLTMGMVLSALMPLVGVLLIWRAISRPAISAEPSKA